MINSKKIKWVDSGKSKKGEKHMINSSDRPLDKLTLIKEAIGDWKRGELND